MKLLLITSTYPTPRMPSQGVFNKQLVAALNSSHSVRVIAPIPWTSVRPWAAEESQANSESTDMSVVHPTFYYPPQLMRWTYGWWYWKSIQQSFQKMTVDFRPDVILGYWAHPDSDAALRAARTLKVPTVVMIGGSDVRILARSGKRRIAIQAVLQNANRVVAFSQDLAKHVSDLRVPSHRIDVVYRGVDRSLFKPCDRGEARRNVDVDSSSLIVVWVGRMVEVKNPAMAIRAAVKWQQQFGDQFRLIMIGEGQLKPGLEQLADQLGIRKCCSFLGALPHAQIANWFQAANLTILTSHSEGVPNVLLESIACGTPFVATDVGGVREIADPQADTLIAADDVSALQDAVIEKLNDRTQHARPVSTYDVHDLAKRMTEVFEKL